MEPSADGRAAPGPAPRAPPARPTHRPAARPAATPPGPHPGLLEAPPALRGRARPRRRSGVRAAERHVRARAAPGAHSRRAGSPRRTAPDGVGVQAQVRRGDELDEFRRLVREPQPAAAERLEPGLAQGPLDRRDVVGTAHDDVEVAPCGGNEPATTARPVTARSTISWALMAGARAQAPPPPAPPGAGRGCSRSSGVRPRPSAGNRGHRPRRAAPAILAGCRRSASSH